MFDNLIKRAWKEGGVPVIFTFSLTRHKKGKKNDQGEGEKERGAGCSRINVGERKRGAASLIAKPQKRWG